MRKPEHFNASAGSNRDPLFYLDGDGRVAYADERCCSSLGYAREELVAHVMADLDMLTDPDKFMAMVELHLRSQESRFESVARRKDGTIFPVEINITDESHGNRMLLRCELHDMSGQVK
ncbi:MAG: PAS domain-containing protein [Nitrosomonadaceae bacterium]|nr:PAS domain-containing protein [Nitrosomonadaceae bacterium]